FRSDIISRATFSPPIETDRLRLTLEAPPGTPILLQEVQFMGSAPYKRAIRIKQHSSAKATGESTAEDQPPVATPTMQAPLLSEPTPVPQALEAVLSDASLSLTDEELNTRLMQRAQQDPPNSSTLSDDEFLDLVARRVFDFFWFETNPETGLTRDRAHNKKPSTNVRHSSIAATGFALAAYPIGVERGWITREQGLERTRNTLRTFDENKVKSIHGIFPHFVHMDTGEISPGSEYSTIDTSLLHAGMINAMEYFDDPEITERTTRLFNRADWPAMRFDDPNFVSHGYSFEKKPFDARWGSFSEGILIYLMAIGAADHPLPPQSWYAIDRHTDSFDGYPFIAEYGFQSIFRFQYPALFFDFRGITDKTGNDYFNNVRIAILAMRAYCIQQAGFFPKSYGPNSWGLGAADGPGDHYYIYGFPPGNPYSPTDGSIIPYAIGGSTPFLPQFALPALRALYDTHRDAWGKYGFADCINPDKKEKFIARDVLGLDQGTILLGIENHRSGLPWRLFMKNRWVRRSIRLLNMKKTYAPVHGTTIDLALDAQWRFHPGDGNFAAPAFNDADWMPAILPDRWENMDPSLKEYDGIGWYRAHFDVDAVTQLRWMHSGRAIALTLGGVDDGDVTYLNGVKIGSTPPGADSFRKTRRYRIPPELLKTKNVLAVQVIDRQGAGGIWLPPIEIGIVRTSH
ncbi:MAG: glucoamylase family protein, partial [Kiritimatiellae bacterium]|nr:glucoamylase family protein [Kiritimatiellia bacterium]